MAEQRPSAGRGRPAERDGAQLLWPVPGVSQRRQVTPRQRELIDRLTAPHPPTQAELAEELGIAESTLRAHLQAAYRTLGVRTLGGAARALFGRPNRTGVP